MWAHPRRGCARRHRPAPFRRVGVRPEARALRPHDGTLLLCASGAHARYGRLPFAETLLDKFLEIQLGIVDRLGRAEFDSGGAVAVSVRS